MTKKTKGRKASPSQGEPSPRAPGPREIPTIAQHRAGDLPRYGRCLGDRRIAGRASPHTPGFGPPVSRARRDDDDGVATLNLPARFCSSTAASPRSCAFRDKRDRDLSGPRFARRPRDAAPTDRAQRRQHGAGRDPARHKRRTLAHRPASPSPRSTPIRPSRTSASSPPSSPSWWKRTKRCDPTKNRCNSFPRAYFEYQDEERRHIARDLHDITGQKLAAQSIAAVAGIKAQGPGPRIAPPFVGVHRAEQADRRRGSHSLVCVASAAAR